MSQHLFVSQRICMFVRVASNLPQGPSRSSFHQIVRNLDQRLLQHLNPAGLNYRRCGFLVVSSHITQSDDSWESVDIFVFIEVLDHSSDSSAFDKYFGEFRRLFGDLSDDSSSHFPDTFIHIFEFVQYFGEKFGSSNSLCQFS